MEENTLLSLDSGVCCSEQSPVYSEKSTTRVRSLVKALSHCNDQRTTRAANGGAFREDEVIVCAVPFFSATATTTPGATSATAEREDAGLASGRNQAHGNILRNASADDQSPSNTTAQLLRVESFLILVLRLLLMFERRLDSLQAVTEAISTSAHGPATRNMWPGTSVEANAVLGGHAADESAPSECPSVSREGDRCLHPQPRPSSHSVVSVAPRKGRRCCFHRELVSRTPALEHCIEGYANVSEPQGVAQGQPGSDGAHSQVKQVDTFAVYKRVCLEPQSRDHPRAGQFIDVTATQSASFSWTPDNLELKCGEACAGGCVEEVFSPASEVSGYVMRLYARCESREGFAMLSFWVQLCASVKNRAIQWPFRGTFTFIIHHPTCSEKSRLYIVPALPQQSNAAVSGVGETLFRLTDPVPALSLHFEGLWAAGTLRLSISVRP